MYTALLLLIKEDFKQLITKIITHQCFLVGLMVVQVLAQYSICLCWLRELTLLLAFFSQYLDIINIQPHA